MEYSQDDYLMISGIQHFKFCRRQWALIHIEQQWAENEHTVVGELMHKKAHDPYLTEKRKDIIIARALPVSSKILGVSGECDIVEFRKCAEGIHLHGHRGMFSVYPVEYKKGFKISGFEKFDDKDGYYVFHAGTALDIEGNIVTNGGRVLGITAKGKDLKEARANAYEAVKWIDYDNKYYRNDIGKAIDEA